MLVETVASTVQSTVDTTKDVAASAVDKGASLVGAAKGKINLIIQTFNTIVVL